MTLFKGHNNIAEHIDLSMIERLPFDYADTTQMDAITEHFRDLGIPVPDYPKDGACVYRIGQDKMPDWAIGIKNMFPEIKDPKTINIIKIMPGRFIAPHVDRLRDYDPELNPIRINVFLQDRLFGHYFEMAGETWMDYKKGDYTKIPFGTAHVVANLGYEPRYTIQISGYVTAS